MSRIPPSPPPHYGSFDFMVYGETYAELNEAAHRTIEAFAPGRKFTIWIDAEPFVMRAGSQAPHVWRGRVTGKIGGPL